ncbi:MAG: hypothetical protein M3O61_14950 [Gemmatimonadota bacterium]|nr:hypothetical protein [Gemmatimonadota bacterium]
MASLFLQTGWNNPALQSRKNSAATSHPPIACGFMHRTRTFPPPMRRHAACSGFPLFARTRFVGKRRAGAPPERASSRALRFAHHNNRYAIDQARIHSASRRLKVISRGRAPLHTLLR